jgi:multiple sugar transport system substrate-binding protein
VAVALLVALLAGLAAACGGSGKPAEPTADGARRRPLTLWILENQPDRMRATRANLATFTKRTGQRVNLVGLGDDDLVPRMEEAVRTGRLPDVVQLGMADAQAYAEDGIISTDAAQEVVDSLGEDTFSARALSLVTREGEVTAVPADGWGQLLIYRRDLFAKAGLRAPRTVEDILRAARRLHTRRLAGITLATVPRSFMAQSFEHIALATGCQLFDDAGRVSLTSAPCRRAFEIYADLARHYSLGGRQDVDSTRDAYFAGRAAMILWSPFLLDAMAGLRNDAVPSCPQCRSDPAFLARNSGLVGPLRGPRGEAAQFGNVSTWGLTTKGDIASAQRLVEYMMTDGYLRWLALSPQGKYPMRLGDRSDPELFVKGWGGLQSGVERRAPLRRFYSQQSIASIGEGALNFQRWGFEQGRAALVGKLNGSEPIASALAGAVRGPSSPAQAAEQAQTSVELLNDAE